MSSMPPAKLPAYHVSLAGTLLAAREAVMAPIRPRLREANVTDQQWRVLRVLADERALDARSLAAAALLHAPTVSRILKELGERGLIERCSDATDARRSIIAITPAGLKLLRATAKHTLKLLGQYAATFGEDRLAALMHELRAFTLSIAPYAEDK